MTNSGKFLDSFAAIEKHLRALARADRFVSFSSLIEKAASQSAVIRRHRDDLHEYADLRNAIVHERSDGRAIAEPHGQVVHEIQRLSKLVLNPAEVLPAFQKQVQTVGTTDSIRDVLRLFSVKNFSQVPVTSGKYLVGLLTSNTVARWLASEATHDIVDLRDHTVADALRHTEHEGNWRIVSRGTSLVEVVQYFDDTEASGKRLDAILVTQTAKTTDSLLGIITIHDMPKVLRLLGGGKKTG